MTADGKIYLRSQQQLVYLDVVSDFLQHCNPIVQKQKLEMSLAKFITIISQSDSLHLSKAFAEENRAHLKELLN